MFDLTGFQRDILYVVNEVDDPRGVDIKGGLDDYYDSPINHGRLYPNLDELVERGLLEKGQKDNRANEYRLTDRGGRELEARREWEDQYL